MLQAGGYTVNKYKNEIKQTEQFKMKDVTFFKLDKHKRLQRLNKNSKYKWIMTVDGFTPKKGNQKNGWKNVSIFHESKGDIYIRPGQALGMWCCYIRKHSNDGTYLLVYWID